MIIPNVKENFIIQLDDNINVIIQPDDELLLSFSQMLTSMLSACHKMASMLSFDQITIPSVRENVIIHADDNTKQKGQCSHLAK
jgi:hypothetical protein